VWEHRWTCPTLTPARQTSTRFTYLGMGRMEYWVDLWFVIYWPQTHPSIVITCWLPDRELNLRPRDCKSNVLTVTVPSDPLNLSSYTNFDWFLEIGRLKYVQCVAGLEAKGYRLVAEPEHNVDADSSSYTPYLVSDRTFSADRQVRPSTLSRHTVIQYKDLGLI